MDITACQLESGLWSIYDHEGNRICTCGVEGLHVFARRFNCTLKTLEADRFDAQEISHKFELFTAAMLQVAAPVSFVLAHAA